MKKIYASVLLLAGLLCGSHAADAQTDVRALYNIYGSNNPATVWVESWGTDSWGDTFLLGGADMQIDPLRPQGMRGVPLKLPESTYGLQYLLVSSVQVATGGHWFEVATSPPATYLSF